MQAKERIAGRSRCAKAPEGEVPGTVHPTATTAAEATSSAWRRSGERTGPRPGISTVEGLTGTAGGAGSPHSQESAASRQQQEEETAPAASQQPLAAVASAALGPHPVQELPQATQPHDGRRAAGSSARTKIGRRRFMAPVFSGPGGMSTGLPFASSPFTAVPDGARGLGSPGVEENVAAAEVVPREARFHSSARAHGAAVQRLDDPLSSGVGGSAMEILVLGGTRFVGRAIVEVAAAREHSVTLFHRGRSGADLFPDLEHVIGDRDGGLDALAGRRFDAVIDTCGYVPRIVRASCEALRDATDHYAFISTLSVYADKSAPGQDESSTLATLEDPTVETIDAATYGGLKVLCEEVVEEVFGARAFLPRPGVLVGPHDPTDRFTSWPVRIAALERVLGPPSDARFEFTNAADLARFVVDGVERRLSGPFNVSGPGAERMLASDFLATCCDVAGTRPEIVAPTAAFLEEHGVRPWADLPLWTGDAYSMLPTCSIARALEAGLAFTPPEETVRATLEWARREHPDLSELRAGLSIEREAELIAAWDGALGS